jgi:hypothetical protein
VGWLKFLSSQEERLSLTFVFSSSLKFKAEVLQIIKDIFVAIGLCEVSSAT